jgi:hypothetical protein
VSLMKKTVICNPDYRGPGLCGAGRGISYNI